MDAKQARLQKQFTAMEAALSASQSAGSNLLEPDRLDASPNGLKYRTKSADH